MGNIHHRCPFLPSFTLFSAFRHGRRLSLEATSRVPWSLGGWSRHRRISTPLLTFHPISNPPCPQEATLPIYAPSLVHPILLVFVYIYIYIYCCLSIDFLEPTMADALPPPGPPPSRSPGLPRGWISKTHPQYPDTL